MVHPRHDIDALGAAGEGLIEVRLAVLDHGYRNRAQAAAALPASLSLTLGEACEIDPPANVKEVVHWRLLSTHRATTLAEAVTIIGY